MQNHLDRERATALLTHIGLMDVLGWIGVVALLGAYALSTSHLVNPRAGALLSTNLLAGILLCISALSNEAYPSAISNAIWATIAAYGLSRRQGR